MLVSSKIVNGINGTVKIPGDKSISHRSIIIPSISKGVTQISNLLKSEDVFRTVNAFQSMNVNIQINKDDVIIEGKGLNSLNKSDKVIDLGNSGTSARLLTGLLSSQNFDSILVGDTSLSKRPMARITKPLEIMGAKF
ncbi:MAG TPA: 3-phosphoshikimate 1-carboxyvinyltransferase, partial [Alphaproteobacteria bacterium]|nr:3-phosphoshikimate 1-carboxyvinyltransferase [Alphaproteobacteria bacterium]